MATKWVPFNLAWDERVPLDLSFVFDGEKPAGKHGFLTTRGDGFVFEDGQPGRFWGTCFNSGANFPTGVESEILARRLAKFGLNIMRTHQMDAEWSTPNLFTANRAQPKDNTRSFDPSSLDRLDYLIYCLKQEGIYTYLDLLTYRQFLPGDGVDAVERLGQAAKPYHYFDERLIELQKEFNHDLWTHTNPYTRLAYKDEPAIALVELVNESDPFAFPVILEPYRGRLETRFRRWCEEHRLPQGAGDVDFAHPTPRVARFLGEVMKDYNRQMIAHLREIGVKIPINGTNWSINLAVTGAQADADFCDSHTYWNFPTWEDPNGTQAVPMVGAANTTLDGLCFARLHGRPFFVSEWDHAWPDPWRAESPLWYAAVAAFQGWGGMTIHTYRYSTWQPEDRLGGGAQTINGITYRNHFDSFNDPAKFGLFYQAALLFRRGDLRQAETNVAVRIPPADEWLLKRPGELPALRLLAEQHRVGLALASMPVDADRVIDPDETLVDPSTSRVIADTSEMGRDLHLRYGWINTPRTQAAYGFLGQAGKISLRDLDLEITTEFATVALSSLTDDPLDHSVSLLLSAVGRCDNTDARYSEDGRRQLSFGKPPILIEAIEGMISFRTSRPNLKVWVISDKGEAVTRLPVEYRAGRLTFAIGPQPDWNPSTMYYLIRL